MGLLSVILCTDKPLLGDIIIQRYFGSLSGANTIAHCKKLGFCEGLNFLLKSLLVEHHFFKSILFLVVDASGFQL